MSRFILLLLLLASVPAAGAALGHESAATSADIALDEKLGQFIPPNAIFRDESGRKVNLKAMIDKPAIIAPVYLHCTHTCPLLLSGLSEALGKLQFVRPGKDFQVITLSFDERETPAVAREKKQDYLKAIGRPFPEGSWKFLTGDAANIRKFTDSVGFKFQRDGEDFSHPVVLIVVAPGGKIVRYLYGTTFLPFDVAMTITEAAEGKTGSTAGKVLTYCFSYDPLKKSYVFNILKVVGTVVVLFVGAFLAYLLISTKKMRGSV